MTDETKSKIRFISTLVAAVILAATLEIAGLFLLIKHPTLFAIISAIVFTGVVVFATVVVFKVVFKSYNLSKTTGHFKAFASVNKEKKCCKCDKEVKKEDLPVKTEEELHNEDNKADGDSKEKEDGDKKETDEDDSADKKGD